MLSIIILLRLNWYMLLVIKLICMFQETYKSFHYTTLLYLGDYGIDFKGGRFVFIDDKYNSTVEPRKGRVSMFTSGSENYHYVEKVTDGVRYAMTVAFSCDKKYEINELKK